ncbi:DUF998 domain-containing protein [Streptacidiphilus jiangxiensis]|uniref:Hypothetical membrane protein n=1 Tax=Streptacidiphilus jiangxiensis TaxID=235985 RepID=A0A1H7YC12_STRJI|nr:hypothetical membrane protein [Streptacidiphilus jiangxiensis]
MRGVAWWAVVSSSAAPVVLVAGWVVAAGLQGPGYDPFTDTISELAGAGAVDPWLMAGAIGVLGVCHLVTALGLRAAGAAGRIALGAGGATAILVALSPVPMSGGSMRHSTGVVIGYSLLALWPALAARRSRQPSAWGLRPMLAGMVTALFLLGALWFLEELWGHGDAGVAERVLTAGQALWPLFVVASCLLTGLPGRAPVGLARRDPAAVRDAWGDGRVQAGGMSAKTLVTVHAVVPGPRPFRRVEIQGYDAGPAFRAEDVLRLCRDRGHHDVNLDDPAQVTWVGGDAATWS